MRRRRAQRRRHGGEAQAHGACARFGRVSEPRCDGAHGRAREEGKLAWAGHLQRRAQLKVDARGGEIGTGAKAEVRATAAHEARHAAGTALAVQLRAVRQVAAARKHE